MCEEPEPAARDPERGLQPTLEPDPQEQPEQFDFQRWFSDRDFKKGRPGVRSDYAHVGDLIGYSADYVERLANGRRSPTKRVVRECRRLEDA